MVAYTTRKDGYNLRISRHSGSKEDYRNEHKQRTEHICEIRNKIDIIIKNNLVQWSIMLDKIINLLTNIKNNYNSYYQYQSNEEGKNEFLRNIKI